MVQKRQFKVLDKWIANKEQMDTLNYDDENLYFYTFFCRKTNEFNFVPVALEDKNKSFIDASLEQTKCELIQEDVNMYDHNVLNQEESYEPQDECFCPNLYFPMAKSSQAHPNKMVPFMSLLERLSLADSPILDLLSFAAKVSISFYDIETLAKPLSENIELKEPEIAKFECEKKSNYIHSIQEAIAIGYTSLCPSFQICEDKWTFNAKDGVDLNDFLCSFLHLSPIQQKEKMKGSIHTLEPFSNAIKSFIVQAIGNPKYLLDSCKVFELGKNSNANTTIFEEPNVHSINSMVAEFLDLAFKQAQFLSLLKKVMLYPLFEHIDKCTSGFKRKGDFTRLSKSLGELTNNLYVFGWV